MVNASLTYEILLYLNSFYFGMFGPCEVGMGVLKGVNLTYTKDSLLRDALLLVSLLIAESIRIYCGRHGSLSDHGETIIVSFFWCSPRQKIYFCERTWLLFFFFVSLVLKNGLFLSFFCAIVYVAWQDEDSWHGYGMLEANSGGFLSVSSVWFP